MTLKKSLILSTTGWFVAVATSLAIRITIGAQSASMAEAVTWLAVACVPPVVLFVIFRGAPPPTIGEILYDTERRADKARSGAEGMEDPRVGTD